MVNLLLVLVHTDIYVQLHMQMHSHTHMHAHTQTQIHPAQTHTWSTHTRTYVCVHAHTYVHTCCNSDWRTQDLQICRSWCDLHNFQKKVTLLFTLFFYYFCGPCGKFGLPYLGKVQQLQEQHYPFLQMCVIFLCVQTMVWLPMFGTLNVFTDADACDCAQGLYGHCRRVWTRWEVDSGRKIPCHTGDSNPH